MSRPLQSIPVISYALSIFYGTSFILYVRTLSVPAFFGYGIVLALFFLILFFCSLGTAKMKESARRNLINFNVLLWAYSLFLLKVYPHFVQPSYILMNLIVILFFSLPSVRSQF